MEYKIADLNVFIENGGKKTEQRGKKYLYDYDGEPDIKLRQIRKIFRNGINPTWKKEVTRKKSLA
ncbi:MAG: hypothetical protein V8S33_00435 [Intestinibacter bartlettii]